MAVLLPGSAGVSPAGTAGVPPETRARTRGGTPHELAGEDARVTSRTRQSGQRTNSPFPFSRHLARFAHSFPSGFGRLAGEVCVPPARCRRLPAASFCTVPVQVHFAEIYLAAGRRPNSPARTPALHRERARAARQ